MKLISICGSDRLGKDSLIKYICNHYNYDNVSIRHCAKPPKGIDNIFAFQMSAFEKEGDLINHLYMMDASEYKYYENILIYNRFYLGEYVYGSLFRNYDKEYIKKVLLKFERNYILDDNAYLILLDTDPEFALSKEDGNSFSQTLEQKTKELELFREAYDFSRIKNKIKVKVNEGNNFRPLKDIHNEILTFLNK